MLETILTVIGTSVLTSVLLFLFLRREIPNILDDVGASIGEQLSELFEKPATKKAMTILGKQSGEVRAHSALRDKAAEGILRQYPSISLILDQLDISPLEGLQLLNDPLIGPTIRSFIEKGTKALFSRGKSGTTSSQYEGKY